MQEIVEIGRATQDELRDDLRELFQGAIRLTLEMVLEEELKAMVGARRFERVGRVKSRFVCKSGGSSSPSARLLGRPPVSGGVRGRGNAGRPRRVWS